jgi:hypothetical protein
VPEQHLDDADIDLLLQEVRGETVPQRKRHLKAVFSSPG